MTHVLHHTVLGFCRLDVLAAVILALVILLILIRRRQLLDRKEELEDLLAGGDADRTMNGPGKSGGIS